jgi:phosphomannomutase
MGVSATGVSAIEVEVSSMSEQPRVDRPEAPSAVLSRIVKAYDIRGLTPEEFDDRVARALGAAFARFVGAMGATSIVVARDMRQTGVALSAAFADGALAEGVDVVDVGLASTDLLYYASGRLAMPGAQFTASHNPAQYNGIKLCLSEARPVGDETGLQEISRIAGELLDGAMPFGGGVRSEPGRLTRDDLLAGFAEHCLGFIDQSVVRPLRIVADTANGMGGLVVPEVLGKLGVHLEVLYGELDGTFPNHPADPIQPENLRDLQARVVATGADIGLAFDGDADRVFLVDELGHPMSGSTTTAMVAAAILEKHPGSTVLHNCICSKAVAEVVRERGGVPVRTRVGHSFIKSVMAETGAVFGGEHSAHYYFRDNWRADSGIIAALHVIELLSAAGPGARLSELRVPFERYVGSGEINTKVASPAAVIERISAAYEHRGGVVDHLDGLTIDFGSWWFNLRPSNTEPLLRLNLEATTQVECESHVAEVLSLVTRLATVR